MSSTETLSVIIPCLNETARLNATLNDVLAWATARKRTIEILVVDDASTDGTADLVLTRMKTTPELELVRLDRNVGKGGAVRAGMRRARGARRCFVDADGAFSFADIDRLEAALDAGADVVTGSRVLDGTPRSIRHLHRRVASFLFRALVRLLLVSAIEDTQCGFKLFCADAAKTLFAEQLVPGFAFDVEVLARAERAGLRIVAVPVQCRERIGSTVRIVPDGVVMMADVLRLSTSRRL